MIREEIQEEAVSQSFKCQRYCSDSFLSAPLSVLACSTYYCELERPPNQLHLLLEAAAEYGSLYSYTIGI